MDLLKIQSHAAKCVIRAPFKGNKPLGLAIWMQSLKSDPVQKIKEKHAEERLALVKGGAERVPGEVQERQGVESFAAAITKWEFDEGVGFGEKDGKLYVPEFSMEAAVDMLSKSDFILDQLVSFAQIEEHFYGNFAEGS